MKILKEIEFVNSYILELYSEISNISRSKVAFLQFCYYIFQIGDSTSKYLPELLIVSLSTKT